ncbi:hypothetical protein AUEXF2481DRAFT_555822 [Aureobasidium subglaciale EXF-2481]|uniref:Uncharacterized protein n=1 Tax=Aureobasidium subglaciale (strain EXF-2481) TaxID=1043005 RepID=A0A074YP41_AURSE|nr:uncharacterized protein AUEXF2481DRAFT_555822 [Aureobasidium subglaciale EXF-2481]KEQ97914.1 hypothetical protein AUEXF2481DRAFT_555822 [Aureobasidium subglaciale EXF-2481]
MARKPYKFIRWYRPYMFCCEREFACISCWMCITIWIYSAYARRIKLTWHCLTAISSAVDPVEGDNALIGHIAVLQIDRATDLKLSLGVYSLIMTGALVSSA